MILAARSRRRPRRAAALALAAGLGAAGLGAAGAAGAESLADAIALAYQSNPSLLAERADLRALDERYVQARAALGPSATVSAGATYDHSHLMQGTFPTNEHGINTSSVRVNLNQPIYSGGQQSLEIRASEADVLSGRQILREQEANVVNQVITAYADVLLNRALVIIARQNVDLLRAQATEIEAEFAVKEVTATDRAQTQARLIAAQIDQARARDALQNAEASYVAAVGQAPGNLEDLPDLPSLPPKVDTAFDAADQLNPSLLATQYTELASRIRLAEARAADGVQVSLGASYAQGPLANYLHGQGISSFETTVSVSKTLFSAGAHTSRVRQALEDNNRDSLKIADARRQVVLSLAKSWNDLTLRRSILAKLRDQLGEEEKAFRGSKLESRIGIRTTIDVLNAEQEFQATKVSLFQVYHDEYLTRAALLAAMGMMQADVIDPGLEAYRPEASFKRVAARTALPWEGVIQAFDQLGAPRPARHPPSRDALGVDRPTDSDPLPDAPHWSDLTGYLPAPSFK